MKKARKAKKSKQGKRAKSPKKNNILTVIYGPYLNKAQNSGHEIAALLGPHGPLDEESLEKIYREIYDHLPSLLEGGRLGYFADRQAIEKISLRMAQEFHYEGISLLCVEDYNKILLDSSKSDELFEKIKNGGQYIENPHGGKSGLLGKFFN